MRVAEQYLCSVTTLTLMAASIEFKVLGKVQLLGGKFI